MEDYSLSCFCIHSGYLHEHGNVCLICIKTALKVTTPSTTFQLRKVFLVYLCFTWFDKPIKRTQKKRWCIINSTVPFEPHTSRGICYHEKLAHMRQFHDSRDIVSSTYSMHTCKDTFTRSKEHNKPKIVENQKQRWLNSGYKHCNMSS